MPPAISDDEISDVGGDIIVPIAEKPTRAMRTSKSVEKDAAEEKILGPISGDVVEVDEEEEEEDDDDEELGEGEFVVEKIIAHKLDDDGNVTYKVKWEGYEKKADQTWEVEDNLKENATVVLDEYLEAIGGRDKIFEETAKAKAGKKRGRPSTGAPPSTKRSRQNGEHPTSATPPASAKANGWAPPSGNWDDHIETIDACLDETTGKLIVYLGWKNGKKTKHSTEVVYKRCPQKMLQYYEKNIRIVKTSPDEDEA